MSAIVWITAIVLVVGTSCRTVKDNFQLAVLAQQDQEDRIQRSASMSVNDQKRQQMLREIIAKRQIRTARDHFNAAIMLQHADSAADYLQAHELAKKAVELDTAFVAARQLIGQSWDRYQLQLGYPQWYGTQRWEYAGKEYLQSIDTTQVTDKDRQALRLSTLPQILAYFNRKYERQESSLAPYIIDRATMQKLVSEVKVEMIGTLADLIRLINYPAEAAGKQLSGVVIVEFTVDANGAVKDAMVAKGLGSGCDEEALRVIKLAKYKNYSGESQELRVRLPFGPVR